MQFRLKPADEVSFHITAHEPGSLPAGELVIQRYWGWDETKDFLVGASIDRDFGQYPEWAAFAGIVMLAAGAAICTRRADTMTG